MAKDYNPKRSQPTSNGGELSDVVERINDRVSELADAATRGLPPGYRFEVDATGPLIRNVTTGQIARMEWTSDE